MTKIYVGGLPYDTDDSQLSEIFSSYGEIASSRVITDRETGRSKGFGFVEMTNDESAQKAIAQMNEAKVGGRTLTVNVARPMEQRSGGSGGSYRGNSGGGYNRGGNSGGNRW